MQSVPAMQCQDSGPFSKAFWPITSAVCTWYLCTTGVSGSKGARGPGGQCPPPPGFADTEKRIEAEIDNVLVVPPAHPYL